MNEIKDPLNVETRNGTIANNNNNNRHIYMPL